MSILLRALSQNKGSIFTEPLVIIILATIQANDIKLE